MQYLCLKQLTAADVTYFAGETIPDGVILPERSAKLISSGYISELDGAALREGSVMMPRDGIPADEEIFTQRQVEQIIAEAVNNKVLEMEKKQKELQEAAGVLQEKGFLSEGTVIIPVKGSSDGDNEQQIAVQATPEEIQQVFSIMQMNSIDGAEAIAVVKSENVLMLLHAADIRKTIKDAAKKQADKLSPADGATNEPGNGNETTGIHAKGVDT